MGAEKVQLYDQTSYLPSRMRGRRRRWLKGKLGVEKKKEGGARHT